MMGDFMLESAKTVAPKGKKGKKPVKKGKDLEPDQLTMTEYVRAHQSRKPGETQIIRCLGDGSRCSGLFSL